MLALVLDRSHAVLMEGGHLPHVPLTGSRPLQTVANAFAARGLNLPSPSGSRARFDGRGRDFTFVIDRGPAPEGTSWHPLRDAVAVDDTIWELYVQQMLGGWVPPTRALDVWSFGDRAEMASQLVHLVACGEKRATMSWIDAAERDGTPHVHEGGVSIVTDGFGYPRVVVRFTQVRVIPFNEIDEEMAAAEGEGDLTYDDWRDGHLAYFTREAKLHGLTFDERARISVERFEVLHVVGRVGGPQGAK